VIKISTVGSIITNQGKQIIINRAYKATPDYTIPTQFKVGIDSDAPNIADTDLDNTIPISNGTVLDDGDVNMSASNSGTVSTSNTTTYKEGAGTNDATSQNLIASGTSSGTASWFLTTLSNNASGTKETACWIYIKDATTYAKLSTGTAVEIRLGSGTATDYYYWQRTKSQLKVGWNWLSSGTQLNSSGSVGTVGSPINDFTIEITKANATDTLASGEVIYDLLRQWGEDDTLKNWVSGTYPFINESTFIAEMRGELITTEANGFDLDSIGDFNTDTARKMSGEDVYTSESKSSTDKFTFVIQDRLN